MFKLICWTSLAVGLLACLTLAKSARRPNHGSSHEAASNHSSSHGHNHSVGNHSHGSNSSSAPRPHRPLKPSRHGPGKHPQPHGGHHGGNHTAGAVKPPRPQLNQTQLDAVIKILEKNLTAGSANDTIDGDDDSFRPMLAAGRRSGGGSGGQQQQDYSWMYLLANNNNNAARQDTGMGGGGGGGGGGGASGSRTKLADDPHTIELFTKEIERLKQRLARRHLKMSEITKPHILFYEQYAEYDPFIAPPEPSNPWTCDNLELWEQERLCKDPSTKRVKRWAFSLRELLKDPMGRENFMRFLEKEVSGENLRFWESVQDLKRLPNKQISSRVKEIFAEFLAPGAHSPVNIDAAAAEITRKHMLKPNRYTFEEAAEHIYNLMGRDSYQRFLRSDVYKELLAGAKKKSSVRGLRSVISFPTRKDGNSSQLPAVS